MPRNPPVEILTNQDGVPIGSRKRGEDTEVVTSDITLEIILTKIIPMMQYIILHMEKITGETFDAEDLEEEE